LSYKRMLVRLLDRPGGRFLLGKIATCIVQRGGGDGVEVAYTNGLWTRRVGSDFFPDSPAFDYTYACFDDWKHQMEQYAADTKEYWLQHYLPQKGDVIVDVGAGRGEDTVTFSRAVGETGRVIAIEAHPVTFASLERFCRLNRLTNVTRLQVALMDKPGTARISESESSWMENAIDCGSGSSGIQVRTTTFEEVWKEQGLKDIAFLKMNIEGGERYALIGVEPVMQHIRQICVACHDFRYNRGEGEQFRTRSFVEQFLAEHRLKLASRPHHPGIGIRDHVFGLRRDAADRDV
jgi:FkbM family methyltransferase